MAIFSAMVAGYWRDIWLCRKNRNEHWTELGVVRSRCWPELLAELLHSSETSFSPPSCEECMSCFSKVLSSSSYCALSTGQAWFSIITMQPVRLYLVGSEQQLSSAYQSLSSAPLIQPPSPYPGLFQKTPWPVSNTYFLHFPVQKGALILNQKFLNTGLQRSSEANGDGVPAVMFPGWGGSLGAAESSVVAWQLRIPWGMYSLCSASLQTN